VDAGDGGAAMPCGVVAEQTVASVRRQRETPMARRSRAMRAQKNSRRNGCFLAGVVDADGA
jgi:sRNA-binding protein